MVSLFFRRLVVAVAILFVALLAYATFSTLAQGGVQTREEVVRAVQNDLDSDPSASFASERAYSIFSAEKNAGGEWTVVVKVTHNPHSLCPRAFLRTYQLLPIRHGVDEPVTVGCEAAAPIAFPEEAIITAGKMQQANEIGGVKKACAYELPLKGEVSFEYCPDVNRGDVAAFASTLPLSAKWVVELHGTEKSVFIALDSNGNSV